MTAEDTPTATDPEREWERAYDEAMQWRDWMTCEILIEERGQADWWKERERDGE